MSDDKEDDVVEEPSKRQQMARKITSFVVFAGLGIFTLAILGSEYGPFDYMMTSN
jgi:hypothetical protein